MKLIFATGNEHKMEEIRAILAPLMPEGTRVVSMREEGIDADPEENGETFAENALIKVRAVANELHERAKAAGSPAEEAFLPEDTYVLADDSGLCIDALDGAPGIYSARFMGHDTPYEEKNKAILDKLRDVEQEKRTARFTCAVACITPNGKELDVTRSMEGTIAYAAAGNGGFGYDPIFYLPEYGCTDAELPPGKKNEISHRGKALRAMAELLAQRS